MITGFHHDNDVTTEWSPRTSHIEYVLCYEMVVPTTPAAIFHLQEYAMSEISRFNRYASWPRRLPSTSNWRSTNRPAVVLDLEQNWNPAVKDAFFRRCTLVPAHFDERNRIRFDEAAVLAALERWVLPPDMEYVERFYYPGRDAEGKQ